MEIERLVGCVMTTESPLHVFRAIGDEAREVHGTRISLIG